jgi:hypothetical protein
LRFAFYSYELRNICEDAEIAVKKYGQEIAGTLQNRLADLDAVRCLGELVIPGIPITIDEVEQYAIRLLNTHQLILSCNHKRPPLDDQGNVNWIKVNYVQILEISIVNETT